MNEEKPKTLGKKILTVTITVIITIIVIFLIAFSWIMVKNPLNIRGVILYQLGWIDKPVKIIPIEKTEVQKSPANVVENNIENNSPAVQNTNTNNVPVSTLPITQDQRESLESFGIDPDSVVITPEMTECFLEKLGPERVEEIKAGATPGVLEMIKASSCL